MGSRGTPAAKLCSPVDRRDSQARRPRGWYPGRCDWLLRRAGEKRNDLLYSTLPEPMNSSIQQFIERFLQEKGKGRGGQSGSYRRDAARELDRYQDWLENQDDRRRSPSGAGNGDREP